MNYDWNFSRLEPYGTAFVSGAGTTVLLTAISVGLGTILGVVLGFLSRDDIMRRVLTPFVDTIRALPPLVLLLFLYYLLTEQVIGYGLPAFWTAALALSLNLAAFVSELVRSAIDSVDPDSVDAALALGLSETDVDRHILFPHVAREALPGLTVLYIGILKTTSLAAIINVRETVYAAQTVISDISRSLEAWIVVGLIYVVLVVPATYLSRRIERWSGRGRSAIRKVA